MSAIIRRITFSIRAALFGTGRRNEHNQNNKPEVRMKLKVNRTDVWAVTIEDRPGGLAEKLNALAMAGANFEFIIARRTAEAQGKGVVYVTPIKGAKQLKAAQSAGFQKTDHLHSLRIESNDKPGLVAKVSEALSGAGINLRGLSAAALGRQFVSHLAFDDAEDAATATSILKKLNL
jgi:hypothetical protein